MRIENEALYTKIGILSKYNVNICGNYSMIENFRYGWLSRYTLAEYYIKYIKALYEN